MIVVALIVVAILLVVFMLGSFLVMGFLGLFAGAGQPTPPPVVKPDRPAGKITVVRRTR